MVYYRKIIKTTTYAGKSFYAYIIEENRDDKTKELQDKIKEFVDSHPATKNLYENVTLGIDQELKKRISKKDKKFIFKRSKSGIEWFD